MLCSLLRIIQLYAASTAVFSTKLMIYTDKTRTPVALSHTISYPLLNLNHNYIILYQPYYSTCFRKHSHLLFYSDGMKRKPHGVWNVKLHQVYFKKNRKHIHYVPIYVPVNSSRDSEFRLNHTHPSVTPTPSIHSSLRPTITVTPTPTTIPTVTSVTPTPTPTTIPNITSVTPTPTKPSIRPTVVPTTNPPIQPTVVPTASIADYKITDTYLSCVKSPQHLYKNIWKTAKYIDKEMDIDIPIIYQCSMECRKKHYTYYGMDSGTQCWCAMTEPDSRKLRNNMCLPCQYHPSTTCGNVNYGFMSVYKIN